MTLQHPLCWRSMGGYSYLQVEGHGASPLSMILVRLLEEPEALDRGEVPSNVECWAERIQAEGVEWWMFGDDVPDLDREPHWHLTHAFPRNETVVAEAELRALFEEVLRTLPVDAGHPVAIRAAARVGDRVRWRGATSRPVEARPVPPNRDNARALDLAGKTTRGLNTYTHDSWIVSADLGLIVCASGCGYPCGVVAADIFVASIVEATLRCHETPEATDLLGPAWVPDARVATEHLAMHPHARGDLDGWLREGVRAAHACIREVNARRRSGGEVFCVATAVVLREGRALIASVGDVRVARWRDGRIERLTRDHTLFEEFGELDPSVELQGVVTRAVGMTDPPPQADVRAESARAGDVFVVYSAGVHRVLDDARVAAILGAHTGPDEIARALVGAVDAAGGEGNATVCVAKVADDALLAEGEA